MKFTAGRGTQIAQRFELDSLLADAGVGECWSARDLRRPDSPAQVQFLSAPAPGGAATREAFEALLARLYPLSNPGILGVTAGGEFEGRLYVVTERLEGRSLANWLGGHRQAGTRPGLTVVQRLFDKTCNALQFAHAAAPTPVVHRALTPRSILLRRVGPGQHHVKVGDFGLAPFSPGASPGAIGAWWEYQAPEQHGGWGREPATVDVFALAVILVEMLSLSALPRAEGRETWWQHVKESHGQVLERLVLLRDDVPRGVWEAVAAAMRPSPKERTPSVQRLQRALREAWQAAGEWQTTAGTEAEPPAPTSLNEASPLVRADPKASARAAPGIDGWRSAERAPTPVVAPAPQAPATVPMPARPSAPAPEPPVNEPTAAIDLAWHGALVAPADFATLGAQAFRDLNLGLARDEVTPPDDLPTATRPIDTAEAFAQLDAFARRELPREAMATVKNPLSYLMDLPPAANGAPAPDRHATYQMAQPRSASSAPPAAVHDPARDLFADRALRDGADFDDPFAGARPSLPPEPTTAMPVQPMAAQARPSYGSVAPVAMASAAPPARPALSVPPPGASLPPAYVMGGPPRPSASPQHAAPRTRRGLWIALAVALLLVLAAVVALLPARGP